MNDADAALPWARRQLDVAEALADNVGIAIGRGQLGAIALVSGRLDEAEKHLAASLAAARAAQEPRRIADALHGLATLAMARGRCVAKTVIGFNWPHSRSSETSRRARAALLEPAEMLPRIGSRYSEPHMIDLGASLIACCAAWSEAVAACVGSHAQRLVAGTPLAEVDRQEREAELTAAREALGNEGFDAAWAVGAKLDRPATLERVKNWLGGSR